MRLPLIAAFTVVSLPLFAQQPDSTVLPRVVITATKSESPLGVTLSSVTVLRGDALREAGIRDVADALRSVPGVAIARSGGPGAQTSLFVRGGESDYVRVLVDGVPMNDPGGAIDLASIPLDNVDRIEVVRGPASVLYGTDAMTGVIQVFTRSGVDHLQADAETREGRYGERVTDASLGGKTSSLHGMTSATHAETRGILPFNNAYRNDAASARLTLLPAAGPRMNVSGRIFDDRYHYPTDGAGNVVDRNARRAQHYGTVAMDADQTIGSRLHAVASLSTLESRSGTEDDPDDVADTTGLFAYRSTASVRRRVGDLRFLANLGPHAQLTAGGELMTETQRNNDSSNYSPDPKHFAAHRSNHAAYGQVLGETGPLSYVIGARYDDNQSFGVFRTGRAAVALRAWHGGTVRASLGTAFKAPSFFETLTTAFSIGNPSLVPERSRTWELGARQMMAGGDVTLAATWFAERFRDVIQYTFTDPALPNYFNVAAANAEGLELESSARVMTGVRFDGSATLLRTRVDDAGFDSGAGATFVRGERLLRRPPVTANLSVSVTRWARTTLRTTAQYTGARDDRDFSMYPASPVKLAAFTKLDVSADHELLQGKGRAPAITIQWRIENVFGARYQEIFNFPTPGRALLIGMRVASSR